MAETAERANLRRELRGIWDTVEFSKQVFWTIKARKDHKQNLRSIFLLFRYGLDHSGTRRKTPMDVGKMVDRWHVIILALATAHGKADIDKAEYDMEEIVTPILSAPVKQLREFYTSLIDRLKEDPKVPWFVWSMFWAWGEVVLKKAEETGGAIKLKKRLAGQIARMVEEQVKPDIGTAIRDALMWRGEETLKEVKAELKNGAKPKLVGRESCLFLKAGNKTVML